MTESESPSKLAATRVFPDRFESEQHYYPRVLNAQIHPLVRYFMGLGNERIALRYCHLHPEAEPSAVTAALEYKPRYFRWGGADLFHVTNDQGRRHLIVIETNSSPSGQKSMPRMEESQEEAGYRRLLSHAFLPMLSRRNLPRGGLAVLYDKNLMEASGYAATLATLTESEVYLVPFYDEDPDPPARFTGDGVLEVRDADDQWHPIRGALRYVTQRPWNRIPPITRSLIFNPVLVCLAGGRNKALAAKAYDIYNSELAEVGLTVRTPETMWDIGAEEVPLWVQRMGGVAVVKVPFSNAGQGVYTITSQAELDAFMEIDKPYARFIVQALIGNVGWSSRSSHGKLYHVGTTPNRHRAIYVADLRFMVGAGPQGFIPIAVYARRARSPLTAELDQAHSSWDMLGTNLSVKVGRNQWETESKRLLLMDSRDFNQLGLGLDDLIEAYLQTVLAVTAIDRMAATLVTQKGKFRRRAFRALSPDPVLNSEVYGE